MHQIILLFVDILLSSLTYNLELCAGGPSMVGLGFLGCMQLTMAIGARNYSIVLWQEGRSVHNNSPVSVR